MLAYKSICSCKILKLLWWLSLSNYWNLLDFNCLFFSFIFFSFWILWGKVCLYSTLHSIGLPRPHLWDCTGYVVIVIFLSVANFYTDRRKLNFQPFYYFILKKNNSFSKKFITSLLVLMMVLFSKRISGFDMAPPTSALLSGATDVAGTRSINFITI